MPHSQTREYCSQDRRGRTRCDSAAGWRSLAVLEVLGAPNRRIATCRMPQPMLGASGESALVSGVICAMLMQELASCRHMERESFEGGLKHGRSGFGVAPASTFLGARPVQRATCIRNDFRLQRRNQMDSRPYPSCKRPSASGVLNYHSGLLGVFIHQASRRSPTLASGTFLLPHCPRAIVESISCGYDRKHFIHCFSRRAIVDFAHMQSARDVRTAWTCQPAAVEAACAVKRFHGCAASSACWMVFCILRWQAPPVSPPSEGPAQIEVGGNPQVAERRAGGARAARERGPSDVQG